MAGTMPDDVVCVIPYKGKQYTLSSRDVTLARLRVLKQQFGYEYGAYKPFFRLFFDGDADAIAGALWIVMSKDPPAGGVPPFDAIDFSPYDIFKAINEANDMRAAEEKSENPLDNEPSESPTSGGDGIATGSDATVSGS